MDKNIKAKWIEALLSGRYIQGKGRLYNAHDATYCCLGVLRDVVEHGSLRTPYGDGSQISSTLLSEHSAGLSIDTCKELARMNDGGAAFARIAEYITNNISGE